ncbi:glycosyltransferase [Limimaricola sp. AA108-03]|uniref:glycosyltransferase n=1 Tax=Limimaricola sp. AA108-03 TaxID=3425945 RepID=UPI003D76BF4E
MVRFSDLSLMPICDFVAIAGKVFWTMTSLHVAQVIGNLKCGGTQELLVQLAGQQRQAGLKLRVIVLSPPAGTGYCDRLRAAGVSVAHLSPGRGRVGLLIWRLARELRAAKVDLVHAHLRRANTLAPIAGAIAGVPVIGGLHLPSPGRRGVDGLRDLAESMALRAGSRGATACSDSVARDNRDRLGSLPTATLANPAPPAPPLAMIEAGRAAGRDASEPVAFLVVGRLAPEKRVETALLAARHLLDRGITFRLSIAGAGSEASRLRAFSRDLGLESVVRFLGSRSDISRLMITHDVYLSASREEGLSIALLEAMAHAMPVIVTPAGSAEALVDRHVGYCVAMEDAAALAAAMYELAGDPRKRRDLGRAARLKVEQHHRLDDWSRDLVRLYERALAGRLPSSIPGGLRPDRVTS